MGRSSGCQGVSRTVSFNFVHRRLRRGCYLAGNHATVSPIVLFGCLFMGVRRSVSSVSLMRESEASLSVGEFLNCVPRSSIVGPDALAGFHQLELGSRRLLGGLLSRAIEITGKVKLLGSGILVVSKARARSGCGIVHPKTTLDGCVNELMAETNRLEPRCGNELPGIGLPRSVQSSLVITARVVSSMGSMYSTRVTGVPKFLNGRVRVTRRVISSVGSRCCISPSTSSHINRGDRDGDFCNCGARVTVARSEFVASTVMADNRGKRNECLPRLIRRDVTGKIRISSIINSVTCNDVSGCGCAGGGGVRLVTGSTPMARALGGYVRCNFICGGSDRHVIYPGNRRTVGGSCPSAGGGRVCAARCFSEGVYELYASGSAYPTVGRQEAEPGRKRDCCARASGIEGPQVRVRRDDRRVGQTCGRRASRFGRGCSGQCVVRNGGTRLGGGRRFSGTCSGKVEGVAVRTTVALFIIGIGQVIGLGSGW